VILDSLRDQVVLSRLACFRDLNSAQIQEFLFDESSLNSNARRVATQRVLDRLKKRQLIVATRRLVGGPGGGSARVVYSLTEAGCRVVNALEPCRPARRPPPRSALFIEHSLMTGDIALAFRRASRADPNHDVSEWGADWQAAERLGATEVVPDAHLVYATSSWELSALIEVDLGTERPSRFAEKIAKYLDVYWAETWRPRLARWPLVLTVTTSSSRATALRRATEDVLQVQGENHAAARRLEFDFAALADLLGRPGPLGAIWQVAGRIGLHTLIPNDDEASLLLPVSETARGGTAGMDARW